VTPAIELARKAGIRHCVHEYQHDPSAASYGLEAADKLGLPPERVFKTLVAALATGELVVAVVPVAAMLNMKKLAKAAGAKKAAMAEAKAVERSSGYVLGGVSPLGQKKALRSFVDESAADLPSIYISAGRRGLEIELAADDLLSLCRGRYAPLC
tara:strand:+ start:2295 stop:2759 length:465 start_codon:yes stop_codon:yes gene_type:complete